SAFKARYRFRAGVEATMSEFDRRTGVKHLRVRGMRAVAFAVIMKAIGLNILRASRFRRRETAPKGPHCGILLRLRAVYCAIKDQYERQMRTFAAILEIFQSRVTKRPEFAV
ncbi:MAG: transposase, partial [Desulfopila sp.]